MFAFVEDIIRSSIHTLFPSYEVENTYTIKCLRNANKKLKGEGIIQDEVVENIKDRLKGKIILFAHDKNMPVDILSDITKLLNIKEKYCLPASKYLRFSDFFSFSQKHLKQEELEPLEHPVFKQDKSIFKAIQSDDILINYPYQTFNHLLQFLQESALDKRVKEISITLYRIAANSLIISQLISAAKNGKKVNVVIELKAKGEELKNIAHAQKLKDEGVNVFFPVHSLKVHAKMLLVTRLSKKGVEKRYAYLGTGNFNEITAKQYTDHALFTSNTDICSEVQTLFNEIENNLFTHHYQQLLVAPLNLKQELIARIDREIDNSKQSLIASISIKTNGIDDKDVIDKLYEASLSGVKIDILVRGICCLIPNREFSKNIHLSRIVDKYLEHGRIYIFENAGVKDVLIGSADLMHKKLDKRLELIFSINSESLKRELIDIFKILLSDNQKRTQIDSNLKNRLVPLLDNAKKRAQIDVNTYLLDKYNS